MAILNNCDLNKGLIPFLKTSSGSKLLPPGGHKPQERHNPKKKGITLKF